MSKCLQFAKENNLIITNTKIIGNVIFYEMKYKKQKYANKIRGNKYNE